MPASPSAADTGPSCMTPLAGKVRVLLVQGDRAAAEPLVLERPAQHAGAADRQPVVAEADRAGLAQLAISVSSSPFIPRGDGGQEADRDRGRGAGALAQRLDVGGVETGGSVLAIASTPQ